LIQGYDIKYNLHIMKSIYLHTARELLLHGMMISILMVSLVSVGLGQNTWDGSSSAYWGTAANWSLNRVPISTDNVVIPDNAPRDPVVDVAAVCSSLTLSSGIYSCALTLNNSLIVSGAVTINAPTTSGYSHTIAVGTASLSCASITMANTSGGTYDCAVTISSGTVTVSGNIVMNGASTENAITFTGGGKLNLSGSMTGGAFTASTSTVNFNGTSAQTIPNGTYIFNNIESNNTSISGATLGAAITATNITGSITVGNVNSGSLLNTNNLTVTRGASDALTVAAGSTLDAGTTAITWGGTNGTATINGTFRTANTNGFSGAAGTAISSTNSPTITLGANSTIEYDAPTGGQSVTSRTYSNLTMSNSGGTQTAAGALTVNGTLSTTSGGALNMVTYALSGTGFAVSNGGTIRTQNTTSTPLPTGKTWGGTVEYDAATGGQTVMAGTYTDLTLSNTSGTQSASGALTVNGTFETTAGGILNMGTNQLLGTLNTITNGGTIRTQNTTSTPLPTGKTWGGTVQYDAGSGGQTVVAGTYNNLTLSNASGTNAAGGVISVSGAFNPSAGTFSTTSDLDFNGTTACGTVSMSATAGTVSYASTATNILAGTYYDLTTNGSVFTFCGTTTVSNAFAPSGTITMSGNLNIGGTVTCGTATMNATSGTVDYTKSTGGQNIIAGIYNNLKQDNTTGTNPACGALTVNGTLTTTATGTLDMGSYLLGGTLTGISNSGTILTASTSIPPIPNGKTWGGTIQYYGGVGQTVAYGTYNNLATNTAGTYTAAGAITLTGGFDNGGTGNVAAILDMGTNALSLTSAKGNNGATIRFSGANNGIGGWTSGTIEYYGSLTGQNVATGEYGSLTINNSNGVTLSGDVVIDGYKYYEGSVLGELDLISGIVYANGHSITVGALQDINGASASRYIDGNLARVFSGTGSKVFPLGKGGNYRPLTFNYTALSGTSTVTAEQTESALPGTPPVNITLFNTRYWSLTESGSTSCSYFVTLDGTGFSPTHTAKMIKGDGSTNTAYAVTTPNYTNAVGFTTFSNFGLGESTISTTTTPDDKAVCLGSTSVDLTATVDPNPGGGTVQFYINGNTAGSPAAVSAGTGIATLAYNPGALSSGAYTIRADFSGYGDYMASSSNPSNNKTLTVNPLPSASAAKTDISCFNAHNGQIVVTGSGGTAPYTYSIDNGYPTGSYQSSNTFIGLAPGQYKIRVMDSHGCESPAVP
jgi:hypothetical protein